VNDITIYRRLGRWYVIDFAIGADTCLLLHGNPDPGRQTQIWEGLGELVDGP